MRFLAFTLLTASLLAQGVPFLSSGQAHARFTPIALVASVQAVSSGGVNVTSSAINTTGSSGLVVVVSDFQAALPSAISDSKSNAWTRIDLSNSDGPRINLFYCTVPCSVGTGHTFSTTTGTTAFPVLIAYAFSGTNTTTFFDSVSNTAITGAAATSLQAGSATCSQNNCLYVAGLSTFITATTPVTINQSFVTPIGTPGAGGQNLGGFASYLVQGTAAALNPTWSWTNSDEAAVVIAAFRAAP